MFKKQRIIVTGAGGRIGHEVAMELAKDNEVYGFDRGYLPLRKARLEESGVKLFVGDFVSGIFNDLPNDPDYVLHFAADCYPRTYKVGVTANAIGPAKMMEYCAKAKAFLYISSCAVYRREADTDFVYTEENCYMGNDQYGVLGHYGSSKIAGEGAVCAMASILKLPAVICRLDVPYGWNASSVPLIHLRALLNDQPIMLPETYKFLVCPIHTEDIAAFMEPLCKAAAYDDVPIVTLASDDYVQAEEYIALFENMTGKKATLLYSDDAQMTSGIFDPTYRKSITGPCKWTWKEGFTALAKKWIDIFQDPEEAAIQLCQTGPDLNSKEGNR